MGGVLSAMATCKRCAVEFAKFRQSAYFIGVRAECYGATFAECVPDTRLLRHSFAKTGACQDSCSFIHVASACLPVWPERALGQTG